MAKIEDVANLAKVSTATVSRVLSDPSRVKDVTRKKVLKAVEELNYSPNILARFLRKMETKTIIVVVPDISNPFFSNILRGIESLAHKNGYLVLLGDTDNGVDQEYKYFDILRQRQVDGMILLTARINKKLVEEIAKQYPVVLACEYLEGSTIPTVSIDNISAARKATEHLIKLNHRRIGMITGPMDIILSRDRLKGYQQAIMQNELEMDYMLVQEGDFFVESGYNLMMKFFALENPPTAIFASSDEMAVGAIKAAKAQGLNVPKDLAVIGFDDIKLASIFEPSITTIAQPMYQIGHRAMDMLIKLINGETLEKQQYVFQDKLFIRESCGFGS
jgi:LacI family transcriptional regulator, repressor for deo operon, udp, cdd, tsx, nupC, and nupG